MIWPLITVVFMAPPPEPLAGKLRAAIWADVELNGMIGNGNQVASEWLNYWNDRSGAPNLHIVELQCHGGNRVQECRFSLLREGGTISEHGKQIADRIYCRTKLRRTANGDDWEVPHRPPPPKGGHSRTTMTCAWAG